MSKPVKSYDDLQAEQQRLEALLAAQRELIRYDLQDLNEALRPAAKAASLLGKFATRNNNSPVLGTAANTIIDLVVKRTLLGRAGLVKKLLVPFVLKNISSHYIADHKKEITSKLFSFFKRKNGKHSKAAGEADLSKN